MVPGTLLLPLLLWWDAARSPPGTLSFQYWGSSLLTNNNSSLKSRSEPMLPPGNTCWLLVVYKHIWYPPTLITFSISGNSPQVNSTCDFWIFWLFAAWFFSWVPARPKNKKNITDGRTACFFIFSYYFFGVVCVCFVSSLVVWGGVVCVCVLSCVGVSG